MRVCAGMHASVLWRACVHACACVHDYRKCHISFPYVFPHLLQQVLLNFFTAIILDNLDLDEETKVQRLKVECGNVGWGGGVMSVWRVMDTVHST